MIHDQKKCEFGVAKILDTLKVAGLVLSTSRDLVNFLEAKIFSDVVVDSRKVQKDGIFLAYHGVSADGHDHLASAIAHGAALLIIESTKKLPVNSKTPWIMVNNGRGAWSYLCALFNGNPQQSLRFFGVTGTNGKTSTIWMLKEMLAKEGLSSLSVGTLGSFLGNEPIASMHTTPDPNELYQLFARAVATGIKVVLMEVSSHSLAQSKVLPIRFEGAGFSSFSRDHLDYHKDMDSYFDTKMLLFRQQLANDHLCAVAASIEKSADIAKFSGANSLYGFESPKNPGTTVKITHSDSDYTHIEISKNNEIYAGKVPYFGSIGIENFVCAFLLASKCLGHFPDPKLWPLLTQVPGRLQRLPAVDSKPSVVIDYAHTPDALEKILAVLRPITIGKIIVVFGCGGNRDQGKRPLMGAIAEKFADLIILTSDNPRDENPEAIMAQIAVGLKNSDAAMTEIDRKKAIQKAIAMAHCDDCVLIAGKGHEAYQIVSGVSYPFDDHAIARAILKQP